MYGHQEMGSTKKNPRPRMGPVLHGLLDSYCSQSAPDSSPTAKLPTVPTDSAPEAKPRRFSIFLLCICILIFFGWIGVPGEGPVAPNVFNTQLINQESSLFQVNILLLSWTVSHLSTSIRIDPLHWTCGPRMMQASCLMRNHPCGHTTCFFPKTSVYKSSSLSHR
jgi:hypothetical protein